MIAALLQLNHGPTIIASLPPSLFSGFEKLVCFFILRTVLHAVPFAVTETAHLSLTATAFAKLATVFFVYISWLDPFPTATTWAVDTIFICQHVSGVYDRQCSISEACVGDPLLKV